MWESRTCGRTFRVSTLGVRGSEVDKFVSCLIGWSVVCLAAGECGRLLPEWADTRVSMQKANSTHLLNEAYVISRAGCYTRKARETYAPRSTFGIKMRLLPRHMKQKVEQDQPGGTGSFRVGTSELTTLIQSGEPFKCVLCVYTFVPSFNHTMSFRVCRCRTE